MLNQRKSNSFNNRYDPPGKYVPSRYNDIQQNNVKVNKTLTVQEYQKKTENSILVKLFDKWYSELKGGK